MEERVNLGKSAPELYYSVVKLDQLATQAIAAAGISEGFAHLLRIRASQMNKCAYSIRLHTLDALAKGESLDRISVLPAWREALYFDERERAALELLEAITLVAQQQVPDSIYAHASTLLSDEEIAAIEWLAVVINAWNRIAVASRYTVEP